jgi:hypothetical protein
LWSLFLSPQLSNFDTLFFWWEANGTHPLQKRKTRTARAKGTSQAHGNYQQYANRLSQLD